MPTVPYEAFPFCGPTYQALSPVVDGQRCINWYPEKAVEPGAKTPVALIPRPGLSLFGTIGSGPIRALWAGNNRLFCVSGDHVYEVSPTLGTVITDFGAIPGAVAPTSPCQFVSNGQQLLMMDSSTAKIYYINPVGPAVTQVFQGFSLDYLDTFFFALSSTVQNTVNQSDSLDGGTWNALNYATVTGTQDLKTRIIVVNNLLWVMGANNIEVWYNTGSAGFVLARMNNGTLNVGVQGGYGTTAALTAVRVRNTLLWMGADERGWGKFWRADGLSPVQISTPGIEALVQSYGNVSNPSSFAEEYNGHIFYVTNFPNANSGVGATLVYDLTTGFWHERTYNNSGTEQRARPSCFASLQGNSFSAPKNFVGDYSNGNIYLQSYSATQDNGVDIIYTRTAPHVSNQNRWTLHRSLTLDGAFGTSTPTLAYSNDGGVNFSTPANMQVRGTLAGDGVKTFQAYQLGRSRDRVYRVKITTDQAPKVSAADLAIEAGSEG